MSLMQYLCGSIRQIYSGFSSPKNNSDEDVCQPITGLLNILLVNQAFQSHQLNLQPLMWIR